LESDLETHVRHGRRNHRIALQLALRSHVAGSGQEHSVAVHHSALRITEQGAIGIAVEGHAEIELPTRLCHRLSEDFRMKSAAVIIDVPTIRRSVRKGRLYVEIFEQLWSLGRCGSVSAVHQYTQLAQIGRDAGSERLDIGLTEFRLSGQRR